MFATLGICVVHVHSRHTIRQCNLGVQSVKFANNSGSLQEKLICRFIATIGIKYFLKCIYLDPQSTQGLSHQPKSIHGLVHGSCYIFSTSAHFTFFSHKTKANTTTTTKKKKAQKQKQNKIPLSRKAKQNTNYNQMK